MRITTLKTFSVMLVKSDFCDRLISDFHSLIFSFATNWKSVLLKSGGNNWLWFVTAPSQHDRPACPFRRWQTRETIVWSEGVISMTSSRWRHPPLESLDFRFPDSTEPDIYKWRSGDPAFYQANHLIRNCCLLHVLWDQRQCDVAGHTDEQANTRERSRCDVRAQRVVCGESTPGPRHHHQHQEMSS